MSRLAKKPIKLPPKTEVSFADGIITVKGPLGELKKKFRDDVSVAVDGGQVSLATTRDTQRARTLLGTYVSHTKNMIDGVLKPYEAKLVIEGIGYKADVRGQQLVLAAGFSHQVPLNIPAGVTVKSEKNIITISGIDKEVVGQFAAVIRSVKKPEPYLGKGIRYTDEVIRRKQGKKTT